MIAGFAVCGEGAAAAACCCCAATGCSRATGVCRSSEVQVATHCRRSPANGRASSAHATTGCHYAAGMRPSEVQVATGSSGAPGTGCTSRRRSTAKVDARPRRIRLPASRDPIVAQYQRIEIRPPFTSRKKQSPTDKAIRTSHTVDLIRPTNPCCQCAAPSPTLCAASICSISSTPDSPKALSEACARAVSRMPFHSLLFD